MLKNVLLLWVLLFSSPLLAEPQEYDIPGSDPSIGTMEGARFWISTYVNQYVGSWSNNQIIVLKQGGLKVTLQFRVFGGFVIILIEEEEDEENEGDNGDSSSGGGGSGGSSGGGSGTSTSGLGLITDPCSITSCTVTIVDN